MFKTTPPYKSKENSYIDPHLNEQYTIGIQIYNLFDGLWNIFYTDVVKRKDGLYRL